MIFGIIISVLFVVSFSFFPWFASFYYYSSNSFSCLIGSIRLYLISLSFSFRFCPFFHCNYSFLYFFFLLFSGWNINSSFCYFSDVFVSSSGFSSFSVVPFSFYSSLIVGFNSFSWFSFSYYSLGNSFLYSFCFLPWSVSFSLHYVFFLLVFLLFLFIFLWVSSFSVFWLFSIPTSVTDFFSSCIDFFSFDVHSRVLGSFLYDSCTLLGYDYMVFFYVFFLFLPLLIYSILNYVYDDFLFLNTSDNLSLYWQDYYYFGCSYFYFFDSYSYFSFMFFSDLDFFFGHDYVDFYWYLHSFFMLECFSLLNSVSVVFLPLFCCFVSFLFISSWLGFVGFFSSILVGFLSFSLWFPCDFFCAVSLNVFIWFDSFPLTFYGCYSFLSMLHVVVLYSESIYLEEIFLWSRVYSNCLTLYYYFYDTFLYFLSSGFSVSVCSWSCYIWSVFCNFYCFVFTAIGFSCSNYNYGIGQFCSFLVVGMLSNFFWVDVFLFSGVLFESGDSYYVYYSFGSGTCFLYQFIGGVYSSLGGFSYSSMFFTIRLSSWLQLYCFSFKVIYLFYFLSCFSLLFSYYLFVFFLHFHSLS